MISLEKRNRSGQMEIAICGIIVMQKIEKTQVFYKDR